MKINFLPWLKREFLRNFEFLIFLLSSYRKLALCIICLSILSFVSVFFTPSSVKLVLFNTVMAGFIDKATGSSQNPFFFILLNNLRVLFLSFILSFTIVIPLLLFLFNGYFIGFFSDMIWRIFGLTILNKPNPTIPFLIVGGLPHGIIEIPTFFLSAFLSIILGVKLIFGKRILPEEKRLGFLFKVLKLYFLILIPLIIIAAGIESTISAKIADSVYSEISDSESDQALPDNLILQKADFKPLGIQVEDISSPTNSVGILPQWRSYGIYLYNPAYYQGFLSNKPTGYISKSYLVTDSKLNVATIDIDILRFNNQLQARNYFVLVKKIFFEQGPKLRLEKVSDNFYKSTDSSDNQNLSIFTYNESGVFVYALYFYYPNIQSSGDTAMLEQINSLQYEKLAKAK